MDTKLVASSCVLLWNDIKNLNSFLGLIIYCNAILCNMCLASQCANGH